jgi:hypothetical protein
MLYENVNSRIKTACLPKVLTNDKPGNIGFEALKAVAMDN